MRARTRAEIAPLVRDLPVPAPPDSAPASRDAAPVASSGWVGTAAGWLVAAAAVVAIGLGVASADSVSIFSSSTVTPAPGEDITVFSVFGSTEVVVPEGSAADNGAIAIFGSAECQQACTGAADADDVEVDGFVLFGSVEITGG